MLQGQFLSEPSLAPERFVLWQPAAGAQVKVGPEAQLQALPTVPLPLLRAGSGEPSPSDNLIGESLYDYLRQFPDCPNNRAYAELLRDAYPHYIADLGAQIVMLEHKEVDAPYVKRKLAYLKILALLQPDSAPLWQKIGLACFDLALTFAELPRCRQHLLQAMGALQAVLRLQPDDLTALNALAQIDYYLGDYPVARRRWQQVIQRLEDGAPRQALQQRLAQLDSAEQPEAPLVDELEAIGTAMQLFAAADYRQATEMLERLEESGRVLTEIPAAEFYYLLGSCRANSGDAAGAFAAFEQALALNPEFEPARQAQERIAATGGMS